MKQFKTEAARVAALIKKELKVKFPGVKFSVRSSTYSMGNSVDVDYNKGTNAPNLKDVEQVTYKYKAGHFDGMTDMYEYTYKGNGPTADYIFVKQNYPRAVYEAAKSQIAPGADFEAWRDLQDILLVEMGY